MIAAAGSSSTSSKNKENQNKSSNNNQSQQQQRSNDKEVFKWKCTSDATYDAIEETKVLEVGKDIEPGEYTIKYNYNSYDSISKQTTMRYNRQYFVYISNKKVPDVNGENLNLIENNIIKSYQFYPETSTEKEVTINVKQGNYIYIYHPAVTEAGDGTLIITKK